MLVGNGSFFSGLWRKKPKIPHRARRERAVVQMEETCTLQLNGFSSQESLAVDEGKGSLYSEEQLVLYSFFSNLFEIWLFLDK